MELAGQGRQTDQAHLHESRVQIVSGTRLRIDRLCLFLGLAISGCAADLITKQIAFSRLGPPPSPIHWLWEGYFGFETSINHGALFGLGQGMVPIFAAVSLLAIGGLAFWIFRGGALDSLLLTIVLGLILGGIIGNLYDRLGMWGHAGVRDWIRCSYGSWVWPNFNIADSLLVCGAALMIWHSWREESAAKKAAAAENPPT